MLVTRFYDRRVVVCLLEKNLLWEEGEEEVGQRLSRWCGVSAWRAENCEPRHSARSLEH
jgi:hypothetical protein